MPLVTGPEVARALRNAQRTHTAIHAELQGGGSADGTPHSVCHRTAWLLTDAAEPEDIFLTLANVLTVRPA